MRGSRRRHLVPRVSERSVQRQGTTLPPLADSERRQLPLERSCLALSGEGQENLEACDGFVRPVCRDVFRLNPSAKFITRDAQLLAAALVEHRSGLLYSQLSYCAAGDVGDAHG